MTDKVDPARSLRHPGDDDRSENMPDLCRMTATRISLAIAAGRVRAEEVAEACLDRIALRDGAIHAFVVQEPDRARTEAARAQQGALFGIPVAVKDVLDTADLPSVYGSPIWEGHQPRADAACVAWTRAAGGVVIGKTVTTEFATRTPGPTANPHDLKRTPGGSSSGSAAAVADFMAPLAFGTQTAGSIIRPAAYCGVVGYKPSFGTIARLGMKVMAESLDTIGVMARSVADCALFAGTVAGRNLGDPDARPDRAPRIGLCRSPAWAHAAAETMELFERVGRMVAAAGATVSACELPPAFDALADAQIVVMQAQSARSMGWELATHRDRLSAALRERMEWGLARSDEEVDAAWATFEASQRAFPAIMGNLDILLTPSAPGEAPEGLGSTGEPVFNAIWTALHVPCITVPAGTGPHGMPLGIQIVGRRGEDRQTLAWAQWVAAAVA
jgi:Asp-tRNA(Asn)/Glu-tRNA(Gln) amidotransferase A subunit family amidase